MERAEAEVEMAAGGEAVHTPHSAPPTAPSARVSIWESVRACGVWGREVDKAELRRRVVMPLYARRAVAAAVAEKDEAAGVAAAAAAREEQAEEDGLEVVTPMVVFVNSKSGGRHGPELKVRLHELISKEQVFDLSVVKRSNFVRYGLGCLERLDDQGDNCAKDIRSNLGIMVAGGDGTVG